MAIARKASSTQSKLAVLLYGSPFSGKTTLALQLSYFKNPDGSPFKVLYIDSEGGGADDYIPDLEANGVDLNNVYIVYTQSLGEVKEFIRKAKVGEEFHELDEQGNETEEIVLDGEGKPFNPDAIIIDGTSILNLSAKQSLVEFSKKRSNVRAKSKGLVGDERLVAVGSAFLELRDYNVLAFKGQDLILDLMGCGKHFVITARETDEKVSVKQSDGSVTSVATGNKVAEGFKGLDYNVKTVIRMFRDEDGQVCAHVQKDRTHTHEDNAIIDDPSLLDWQAVIDKTAKNKAFVVKNNLVESVEKEQDIYEREVLGREGKPIDTPISGDSDSTPSDNNSELIAEINSKMKSFSAPDKAAAKKALEAKGLPATPKAIKSETDEEVLKTVLETINAI